MSIKITLVVGYNISRNVTRYIVIERGCLCEQCWRDLLVWFVFGINIKVWKELKQCVIFVALLFVFKRESVDVDWRKRIL